MPPAISIENLGKRYRIDHEAPRGSYRTLRESLVDMAASPLRRLRGQSAPTREDFWALKDVSFEVQRGEVIGIIGRNGAGKSTLLKILSRITKPTTGRVRLNGRVGSLLEVGTGFHPELTGRENIYLNGSILGMSRREITRKFDEIVDFADVERFLDTPVKRYSSGMYVRLAFSVAAHLEPEILIVDEVLAVGDVDFQKKCLGKMQGISNEGTTVLFVSHNMAAVEHLCSRAIIMASGKLTFSGTVEDALANYRAASPGTRHTFTAQQHATSPGRASILKARMLSSTGAGDTISMGQGFTLEMTVRSELELPRTLFAIGIYDIAGRPVCIINSEDTAGASFTLLPSQATEITCHIPHCNLMPGVYRLALAIQLPGTRELLDRVSDAIEISIVEGDVYGTGRTPRGSGVLFLPAAWTSNGVSQSSV